MQFTTLDGISYPMLTAIDAKKLEELVKTGGFSKEVTQKQKIVLRHIKEDKAVCLSMGDEAHSLKGASYIFMTTEQAKVSGQL